MHESWTRYIFNSLFATSTVTKLNGNNTDLNNDNFIFCKTAFKVKCNVSEPIHFTINTVILQFINVKLLWNDLY